MAEVGVDLLGVRVHFLNGRNRVKYAADTGLRTIPVAVPADEVEAFYRVIARFASICRHSAANENKPDRHNTRSA